MLNVYLVAYDVTDDKRRQTVYHKLKGFGESVQLSIFRCTLTSSQLIKMRNQLWPLINHEQDRLLIVDLGAKDGRGTAAWEFWGKPMTDLANHDGIMIV